MSLYVETNGGMNPADVAVAHRRCSHEILLPKGREGICISCLLQGIVEIFRTCTADTLASTTIVECLSTDETFVDAVDNAQKLAALLYPELIRPQQMRINGKNTRGYRRHWFEKALASIQAPRPS